MMSFKNFSEHSGWVCGLLLLVLLMPTASEAGRARILGLGGGDKSFTIDDPLNIWRLPATLVQHTSWVGIETAGAGETSFGIHFPVGDDSVVALYGTSTTRPALSATRAGNLGAFLDSEGLRAYRKSNGGEYTALSLGSEVNEGHGITAKGTVFFASRLGDWGSVGVRAGVWADNVTESLSAPNAEVVTEKGPLVIDTALGFGAHVLGGRLDLSVGFDYGTYQHTASTAVEQAGSGTPEPAAETRDVSIGNEYRISGLLMGRWELFEGWSLIPFVDGFYVTTEGKPGNVGADEIKYESIGVYGGFDLAIEPVDWLTIQPGLAFGYGHSMDELVGVDRFEQTVLQLPSASLSLEMRFVDWLDVRMGGGVVSTKQSGTAHDDDSEGWKIHYRVGGGLGFHLPADVHIDVQAQYGEWSTKPLVYSPAAVDGFGVNIGLYARW